MCTSGDRLDLNADSDLNLRAFLFCIFGVRSFRAPGSEKSSSCFGQNGQLRATGYSSFESKRWS